MLPPANHIDGEVGASVECRNVEVEEDVFASLPVVIVTANGEVVKEIVIYS